MVFCLNPEAKLFGADALTKKIKAKFSDLRENAKATLNMVDSKISLTTDMWTSNSAQIPFMVITGHYLDANFEMKSFLLDFIHVPGSHTGAGIAEVFIAVGFLF